MFNKLQILIGFKLQKKVCHRGLIESMEIQTERSELLVLEENTSYLFFEYTVVQNEDHKCSFGGFRATTDAAL